MMCAKSPHSLLITTGTEMGANYGGTPHGGGSYSPSSNASTASSSPCPSTPSSSSHNFNTHHNHFQQRIGDTIPPMDKPMGTGWNGGRSQQRVVRDQRKARGAHNWYHMQQGNFMHPPFPPPFFNGHPPFFPPPPPYSRGPIDTSIPPPPYHMMPPPPPFFPFPPPPHPSMFMRKGGNGYQHHNHHQQQQQGNHHHLPHHHNHQQEQDKMDSRPSSRGGGGSMASTDLSCGEHSQDSSYETSSEEETYHQETTPVEIEQGKRSYLVHLRPKWMRDELPSSSSLVGHQQFKTFSSILTGGNKKMKETEIMDQFIVEYMKLKM